MPTVTLSALRRQGLEPLLDAVLRIYGLWNRRIGTAKINQWLQEATDRHPPPLVEGRRVKLRYGTQVKSRPPTFALFGNQLDALPEAYGRYLTNGLREAFGLNQSSRQ